MANLKAVRAIGAGGASAFAEVIASGEGHGAEESVAAGTGAGLCEEVLGSGAGWISGATLSIRQGDEDGALHSV